MKNILGLCAIVMALLIQTPAFAKVYHGNGYAYIPTGKRLKLEDSKPIVDMFLSAFGGSLDAINTKEDAPKLSKSEGAEIGYILRDPGKARGERPAKKTITVAMYNQPVPQAVLDLAVSEFGADLSDFDAFPLGVRLNVRENSKGTFSARFYAYRIDRKRDGTPETVDLGEGTMLPIPLGINKFTTQAKQNGKTVVYTLYGRGGVKDVSAALTASLKGAGFDASSNYENEDGFEADNITFSKGDVRGLANVVLTTTKEPSVNLLITVNTQKCKSKYGELSVPKLGIAFECI